MAEQVTYMLLIQDSTGQVYKHPDNVEIPTGFSMMMVADDGRIYRNPTIFVANSVAEALDKKGISYEYENTTKTRIGGVKMPLARQTRMKRINATIWV